MLVPKEALKQALDYFADTFPQGSTTSLSLESLVMSDDKKEWITTLSFRKSAAKDDNASSLDLLFAEKPAKEIRTIRIDSESGEFIAIESPNLNKK